MKECYNIYRATAQNKGDTKMFKLINSRGRLTETAKDVFKDAYIAGGANEFIIFPNAFADDRKYKRVTDLMKSINCGWHAIAGNKEDIYVVRHWFIEAVADRSERASIEVRNIIGWR